MSLELELLETGTETVPACNICGQDGVADPRWSKLLKLPLRYGVNRCRRCALRWLSPRPDEDGLAIIYSDDYYFFSGGVTDFQQYARQRDPHFYERIMRIKAAGVSSVLDYGAATGNFVSIARKHGLAAEGIEFSADARKQAAASGVKLLGPRDAVGRFDAIHMNHVFEHVPDPSKHLQWCTDHLNHNGLLVIEVPLQFDNPIDRLRRASGKGGKKERFDAFSVHHTFFYTTNSLRLLLDGHGFEIETMRTPLAPIVGKASLRRRLIQLALGNSGDTIEAWARIRKPDQCPAAAFSAA